MNDTISGLRGKRTKAAQITLAAHLGAAVALGFMMVISEDRQHRAVQPRA
jgi:hypothetical protein